MKENSKTKKKKKTKQKKKKKHSTRELHLSRYFQQSSRSFGRFNEETDSSYSLYNMWDSYSKIGHSLDKSLRDSKSNESMKAKIKTNKQTNKTNKADSTIYQRENHATTRYKQRR